LEPLLERRSVGLWAFQLGADDGCFAAALAAASAGGDVTSVFLASDPCDEDGRNIITQHGMHAIQSNGDQGEPKLISGTTPGHGRTLEPGPERLAVGWGK
jgi:hypothetical protein